MLPRMTDSPAGRQNSPVAAFTCQRGPIDRWEPTAVALSDDEQRGPRSPPAWMTQFVQQRFSDSAKNQWKFQLMPICSMRVAPSAELRR